MNPVPMLLRLLPVGPQREAAEALAQAVEADAQATEVITTHVRALTPLADAVKAGDRTAAEALAEWLVGYQVLLGSDEVRTQIRLVLQAIADDPEATNRAVGPAMNMLGHLLPR